MGAVYAVVARAAGPILRRFGLVPRTVLAGALGVWGLAALLPLAFPSRESALWVAALTGAVTFGNRLADRRKLPRGRSPRPGASPSARHVQRDLDARDGAAARVHAAARAPARALDAGDLGRRERPRAPVRALARALARQPRTRDARGNRRSRVPVVASLGVVAPAALLSDVVHAFADSPAPTRHRRRTHGTRQRRRSDVDAHALLDPRR